MIDSSSTLRERPAADLYIARFLPKTRTLAIRASCVAAIFGKKYADVEFIFLCFQPLEKAFDATPAFVAVDDAVLLKIGQVGERNIYVYVRRCRVFQKLFLPPMREPGV